MGKIFIIFIFLCTSVIARGANRCDSNVGNADDRVFAEQLRMMRERQAGFEHALDRKKMMESAIRKGVAEYKAQKKRALQAHEKARREAIAERIRYLRERRRRMEVAWRVYNRERMREIAQQECVREAFIKKREKYLREADKIVNIPEDVDSGLKN